MIQTPVAPRLWLDEPEALSLAAGRIADEWVRRHVGELITDGYTVIRKPATVPLCDEVVADYYRFCDLQDAGRRGKKSRIVNFHVFSDAARKLLLDPFLMRVLDAAFGHEAVLWTSLTFEYGTEQRIHRDSPYFETRPFGYYVGVWTALEDVSPDAGPLAFIPGGHRIPATFDLRQSARDHLRGQADGAPVNYDLLLETFFSDMDRQCESAGLNLTTVEMKKGDKLIWHHWLPHGGAPAASPELTRRSIVGHYIPLNVPIYNVDVFFGIADADPDKTYTYLPEQDRKYIAQPAPFFQTAYI